MFLLVSHILPPLPILKVKFQPIIEWGEGRKKFQKKNPGKERQPLLHSVLRQKQYKNVNGCELLSGTLHFMNYVK